MNTLTRSLATFLTVAVLSSTAAATDVGVSVNISQPGFYGRIDIGRAPQPVLIYPQPVIIEHRPMPVMRQPIYLRVPPGHEKTGPNIAANTAPADSRCILCRTAGTARCMRRVTTVSRTTVASRHVGQISGKIAVMTAVTTAAMATRKTKRIAATTDQRVAGTAAGGAAGYNVPVSLKRSVAATKALAMPGSDAACPASSTIW